MRIIAKSKIVDYYTENPEAEIALEDWYHKTKLTEWNNFADMKKTFNSVDNVGNQHYVFNIKGNNYRLLDYPRNHQRLCAFKPCHTVWLY